MSSSFEKSVKGGTKIKLAPPKAKYVEHILLATHSGEAGVAEVFRTLKERLRDSTWTIVFKALIIVHLMIKEGEKDVTLAFLAQSPQNRLAINSFTDVQTQGQNIRRYSNYLIARAQGFANTKVDYVRSGNGRMRALNIDKGLLRETECVQSQIRALLKCNLLDNEPENEISLTAFRLLTKDLLDLFAVMNEAVMNVLSHYFELSKVDAEHAISIYKTFARQTDQVVQYLSIARQYERVTKLEIPKVKHAPTSLAASLQEYIDDKDFDVNRRQYLAEQQAKKGTVRFEDEDSSRPFPTNFSKAARTDTKQASTLKSAQPQSATKTSTPAPAPAQAPELIDFFGSIEQDQAPAVQQYQQPVAQDYQQAFAQQPPGGVVPSGQTSNPFGQVQSPPYQQPPQIQTHFTGAGFGGYGPQPQQQQQQQQPMSPPQQTAFATSNPFQTGVPQSFPPAQQPFAVAEPPPPPPQQQQQQQQHLMQPPQATNPFRQSMMATGQMTGFSMPQQQQQPLPQQSTNPFAHAASQQSPMATGQFGQQMAAPPVQAQPTGTNPFARQMSPTQQPQQTGSPAKFLTPAVTGSTNPFRQSAFVNQQTGQGWQNSSQASMGGWEQVDTVPVFPRPGQA